MEQTIENFEGTKNVTINEGGSMGDVQAGIEYISYERTYFRCRCRNNIFVCLLCSVSMAKESN